jgi:hypothetical protein
LLFRPLRKKEINLYKLWLAIPDPWNFNNIPLILLRRKRYQPKRELNKLKVLD